MEATIRIDDSNTLQALIQFLKSLNIDVEMKEMEYEEKQTIPKSKFKSWEDMKKYFGIWKGRNINKESLRKKAWRTRK